MNWNMTKNRSSILNKITLFIAWLACLLHCTEQQRPYPPLLSSALKILSEGIFHANSEPPNQWNVLREYDFIIVGAGSAGCVLANRLTENPDWKVLLIEAGQDENYIMDIPLLANMLQFSDANWKHKSVPSNKYCLAMENHQCKLPRGKVMGGSSVLNYMIYTRGNWRDYDNWANNGCEGWDFRNVLRYFKKAEDTQIPRYAEDAEYRSVGGYQTVSEIPYRTKAAAAFVNGGAELGYPTPDVNGRSQIGFAYHQVSMRNGTRCSTTRAYLHPIRNRRNLHVKKYSMVTRIMIDPKTKTAYGVEFVQNRRKYSVLARKEVVLTAGAIASPQLLMLSGVGPKDHLQEMGIPVVQDLSVGYNFMDHVALGGLTFIVNDTVSLRTERILDNPNALNDFLSNHRGPISVPGGTEAIAFIDTENPKWADGWPDLELLFVGGMISSETTLKRSFGITDYVYNKVYKPTEGMDGIMIFPMIMRPRSKGRIMLRDTNPYRHPLIYTNYYADERDLDIFVHGVRISQKLMKTKPWKRLKSTLWKVPLPGCVNITFDTDEYWKCHGRNLPFTIYHYSGTCKMGAVDDPTAVVDPRLRVKGVNRLRVIDSSVIPEIPSAHTNAPTIMIAEKGSDLIKEDWNFTPRART